MKNQLTWAKGFFWGCVTGSTIATVMFVVAALVKGK